MGSLNSGRTSCASRGRLGTWNLSGPCSEPPLSRLLLGAVVKRLSVPAMEVT